MALSELTFYTNFRSSRFIAFSKIDFKKKKHNQRLLIRNFTSNDGFCPERKKDFNINSELGNYSNNNYYNIIFYEYTYEQLTHYNLLDLLLGHMKYQTNVNLIEDEVDKIQKNFLISIDNFFKNIGERK